MERIDFYKWRRVPDYVDSVKRLWKISYARYGAGWYLLNLRTFDGIGHDTYNIRMRVGKWYNMPPDRMTTRDVAEINYMIVENERETCK